MRIAFVDIADPKDPHAWSGIPARMIDGFSGHSDVQVVGNVNRGIREIYFGHKVLYRMAGLLFDEHRTEFSLRTYSRRLGRALSATGFDAIVAPGSLPIAHLASTTPTAFWTDACFGAMPKYYDDFSRLCPRSRLDGEAQERAALERCHLAIYASAWAADQCRNLYPQHAHKVRVVPFGANLDPEYQERTVAEMVAGKSGQECHLLFVGVNWTRKGGNTVLEAARIMNAAGVDTRLTIVGCAPPAPEKLPRFVEVAGFLSRAVPAERKRLAELFRHSHFLVLPSRAEAFGIVLCEAAAFAVPSIASRTGGIPSIIDDDITGRLLPRDADGQVYANAMLALFAKPDRYTAMSMAAYRKYRQQLNWDVACKSTLDFLRQVM